MNLETAPTHRLPPSEIELSTNRPCHGPKVVFRKGAHLSQKPLFGDGGDLVGHGLLAFACHVDIGLRGVEAGDLAGDRHDLEPVQHRVRGVVAHDDGWAGFLDFPAKRRIKGDQPDIAAT